MDKKLLILKIFLKHIKRYHMYAKFRCSINQGASGKDLYHIILRNKNSYLYNNMRNCVSHTHSPFTLCKNFMEILGEIDRSVGGAKIEDTTNGQTQIMNIINLLIHSCIEYAVTSNIGILEKIGNDVFNDVCKSLFGEDFTDKTAKIDGNGQMSNVFTMEDLKNMIGGDAIKESDLRLFLKTFENSFYGNYHGNYRNYYMDYPSLDETYITNNY